MTPHNFITSIDIYIISPFGSEGALSVKEKFWHSHAAIYLWCMGMRLHILLPRIVNLAGSDSAATRLLIKKTATQTIEVSLYSSFAGIFSLFNLCLFGRVVLHAVTSGS